MAASKIGFGHLSFPTAVGICCGLSAGYVGSLYLFRTGLPRDHPATIKRRILVVSGYSLLCPIVVRLLGKENIFGKTVLNHLGIYSEGIVPAIGYPLALTSILFLGPIVEGILDEDLLSGVSLNLQSLRNFVVAPITEEFVYRGCLLPFLAPHMSTKELICYTPLFFGFAHLHHLIEGVPLPAIVGQFLFTSVFGALATYLHYRTGNILAPIVCHSFCNMMGVPSFNFKHNSKLVPIGYVTGLVMFAMLLSPLTEWSLYHTAIPILDDSIGSQVHDILDTAASALGGVFGRLADFANKTGNG